eukprot:Seg1631.3 transcript_id=Seg1631.3/GoldUCD/mRNA.D3Y31 product="Low density lipoprotein receptor adapter protein 1" protein_id=Seg1631.3/GoldUCD/D3Y31
MAESGTVTPWKATSYAFSSRYKKLQLNSEIPTFYVGFLGKCEVDQPLEVCHADYRCELVSQICANIREVRRQPRKVELSISWHGIEVTDLKTGFEELIPIFMINRGMTDVNKPRIFAFLSQNPISKLMECQAFVSMKAKTSWAMTLSLKRSFEVAYEAWKTEQKRKLKFHDNKLLELAEDLMKNRDDSFDEGSSEGNTDNSDANFDNVVTGYSPRTTWTQFEEDLMANPSPSKRFSMKKSRSSHRRIPSIKEVVGQPAVDNMFKQRQKLVTYASVFDVGDNEGLRKMVEDEEVQIMSLTGMDKKEREKESSNADDLMKFC